jgi:hypothetical protein
MGGACADAEDKKTKKSAGKNNTLREGFAQLTPL